MNRIVRASGEEAIGIRQFIGWLMATWGVFALVLGICIFYGPRGMDVRHG